MAPKTTTTTGVQDPQELIGQIEDYITSNELQEGTALRVNVYHDGRAFVKIRRRVWRATDFEFSPVLEWLRRRFQEPVRSDNSEMDKYTYWVVVPRLTRGMTLSVAGLTWAHVAVAFNRLGITPKAIDGFKAEYGLVGPFAFVGNNAKGHRDWTLATDRSMDNCGFMTDGRPGSGWYVFAEGDVIYLYAVSASGRSSLAAHLQADGCWSLDLWVSLDSEGVPDMGPYWEAFHEVALGIKSDEPPS